MNLATMAEVLTRQPCTPSSHAELNLIEASSGLVLPASFRQLWLVVGGCRFVAKISSGSLQGEFIASFWNAQEILKKLNANSELESAVPGTVVPFADDFWGNTFFLMGEKGTATRVLIADWNSQTVDLVADSFDAFLASLEWQSTEVGNEKPG